MNILIIEDEINLTNSLKLGLEEIGYTVDVAFDGIKGLADALAKNYHIIISDIMMPGISGLEFCTIFRKSNTETPILFLSALGTTDDKLKGFDVGADDYLTKPFSFDELKARLNVIAKRYNITTKTDLPKLLHARDLTLDLDAKTVIRNGHSINLTAKEFHLITYLIENKNKIISKKEIAENVWGITFETGTNTIEVYVNFTRNKIDKDFDIKLIHTIHGRGYMIKD